MALFINTLLQENALDYANYHQIVLIILQHKTSQICLVNNGELHQQIYKYIFQISNKKMKVLIKNKMLRLLVTNINSKTLEKFDIKVVAER